MRSVEVDQLLTTVRRRSRFRAPVYFSSMFACDKTTADWMERNGLERDALLSAAYSNLVITFGLSSVGGGILLLLIPGHLGLVLFLVLQFLPLIMTASLLQAPKRMALEEQRMILVESPTVMGMLSMSMHLSPSMERATAYAALSGEGALSQRIRDLLWESYTGWGDGITEGLERLASSLGQGNRNLCQALHMLSTAAAERSRVGLERLLERANELTVNGVRDRMDQYVTSLSLPTMVLFAFGVLLPVMLFSLVPLLTIRVALGTDTAGEPVLGTVQIAFLMLLVFPTCAFLFAQSTLRRHPLRCPTNFSFPRRELMSFVLISASGGAVSIVLPFGQPYSVLLLTTIPPCLWWVRRFHSSHASERSRPALEEEFSAALYQVGNQLLGGTSIESSLLAAAEMRRPSLFASFVDEVLHKLRASGIPLAQAMAQNAALSCASPLVRNAFITVAGSAEIDAQASGRTAVNLARYIWELRESERKGRERMRSVVDMMTYTTMLFAPIVLAITGGLYQVVASISPMGDQGALLWIGGVYVVELSFVICYFNQNLLGRGNASGLMYAFGRVVPVAMTTFVLASIIAEQGLGSLF